MENLNLALTLLLAGFVIVFLVLVLLILIITVYGKIIQFAQKAVSKKNQKVEKPAIRSVTREEIEEYDSDEIPEEIISQNKKCKAFPFHSFFLGQCGHC